MDWKHQDYHPAINLENIQGPQKYQLQVKHKSILIPIKEKKPSTNSQTWYGGMDLPKIKGAVPNWKGGSCNWIVLLIIRCFLDFAERFPFSVAKVFAEREWRRSLGAFEDKSTFQEQPVKQPKQQKQQQLGKANSFRSV